MILNIQEPKYFFLPSWVHPQLPPKECIQGESRDQKIVLKKHLEAEWLSIETQFSACLLQACLLVNACPLAIFCSGLLAATGSVHLFVWCNTNGNEYSNRYNSHLKALTIFFFCRQSQTWCRPQPACKEPTCPLWLRLQARLANIWVAPIQRKSQKRPPGR